MEKNTETGMRLAKYLAAAGIASRRRCEELIREGRVLVNGSVVLTPAVNIDASADEITCEGRVVKIEKKAYVLLHKPAGYTCSASDPHASKLVFELIPKRFGRLFTVGRLDRDSEGLLILTNDGDLAQELTHPSRQVPKRYLVSCEGSFTTATRRQLLDGVYDGGEFLQPLNVEQRGHYRGHAELEMTLTEGKKREVRRLCKAVGLTVGSLQRISFGSVELGTLAPGTWRQLGEDEVEKLRKTAAECRAAGRRRPPRREPPLLNRV
ncbi:MAG: pseudouridine synthase [Lentisphaeria bacterium]|nr:pseudouridine synthase [Lentisphaeria bacterium]